MVITSLFITTESPDLCQLLLSYAFILLREETLSPSHFKEPLKEYCGGKKERGSLVTGGNTL